ncbi:ImcF-related family protein [Paraburkholderia bonniea]|uniref:ImcF-related family protein n=1 Tax=Paraburkholderia bonniea TaxID=2152891 RepID=UPI001292726E|nr:ImcF-related family protein [Paraburkholderia bonniea]
MKQRAIPGYWLVVSAATVGVAVIAWFKGTSLDQSPWHRVTVVLLAGALLMLLRGPVTAAWRFVARRAPKTESGRYRRDPSARVGMIQTPEINLASQRYASLRLALHTQHGFFWRYRRPWLLLTGDVTAITRLLPDLAAQNWLITADAVLLWHPSHANGQPDEAWLRQLYKLRRRRPIDAVILTINGEAELPTTSHNRYNPNPHHLTLARIAQTLRWSAPVYLLDVAHTDAPAHGHTPVIGCTFPRHADAATIEAQLLDLRTRLGSRSVKQIGLNRSDLYQATLSKQLDSRSHPLAQWLTSLTLHQRRTTRPGGAFFAPYPTAGAETTSLDLPLWSHLADIARRTRGQRTGWHPVTVCAITACSVISLWTTGMLVSGLSNARELHQASQAAQTLATAPDTAAQLRALLTLQQQISDLEARTQQHTPLLRRFGLNRDREILAALWPRYQQASQRLLVQPVQQNLEATLADLGQMPATQVDTQVDEPANRLALNGHATLKTYLMLAEPQRADAAFLTPQLVQHWSTSASLSSGEKFDLSERLLRFYAQRLPAHEPWRITPRPEIVNAARQTLLAVTGVKNSEDTIYQRLLQSLGNKYPDQTLASLSAGTDTRGLLRSTASVPGAFTRQAYEGTLSSAIDEAAQRNDIAHDWVLTGTTPQTHAPSAPTADALKTALTQRYFSDYASHWQRFMNTLQWAPAPTLPSAIEQLTQMADARQSPVLALMKSLDWQGRAGILQDSLSDTLVSKAQTVFAKKTAAPDTFKPMAAGPLAASFGPVRQLVAADPATTMQSDLSLQRFMERVTTLRLKLQQISDSPDADTQARQMAQALFQGKGSTLADTQAYAQLVAASLGAQWAGLGDTLFVRPVSQATRTVLQPAQASLNDAWQQTIGITWQRAFAGRYPFAGTRNDASVAELTRFLRRDGGLIPAFLGTQLAGVLELQGDRWMPVARDSQALAFDPAFLRAVNTLQRLAGPLLASGEAHYRFELKPVPTPGITDTVLTLDGQKLHYYNQRETWQTMAWPSNDPQATGTRLQWQTAQAGTNKHFEFSGRWGLIRMLEQAEVEPLDGALTQLTWQARPDTWDTKSASSGVETSATQQQAEQANEPDPQSLTAHGPRAAAPEVLTYPVRYQMRTEAGQGPLELLALRGFVLPQRIFIEPGGKAPAGTRQTARSNTRPPLPPLPQAALEAARHAVVPLPEDL